MKGGKKYANASTVECHLFILINHEQNNKRHEVWSYSKCGFTWMINTACNYHSVFCVELLAAESQQILTNLETICECIY